jgi:hypothetical protein
MVRGGRMVGTFVSISSWFLSSLRTHAREKNQENQRGGKKKTMREQNCLTRSRISVHATPTISPKQPLQFPNYRTTTSRSPTQRCRNAEPSCDHASQRHSRRSRPAPLPSSNRPRSALGHCLPGFFSGRPTADGALRWRRDGETLLTAGNIRSIPHLHRLPKLVVPRQLNRTRPLLLGP